MENKLAQIQHILTSQKDQVLMHSPSPFMVWLAAVVKAVNKEGLIFEYTISEEMTNPIRTLHGGITAAIMDDLIGATIICLGRQHFYTTVNNVFDYFAGAKLGDIVTGKTFIVKAGRQIINVNLSYGIFPKKDCLPEVIPMPLKLRWHVCGWKESIRNYIIE